MKGSMPVPNSQNKLILLNKICWHAFHAGNREKFHAIKSPTFLLCDLILWCVLYFRCGQCRSLHSRYEG